MSLRPVEPNRAAPRTARGRLRAVPTPATADLAIALALALVEAGVESVRSESADGFVAALAGLPRLDVEVVGIVEAGAVRSLLEERHPDGLDADDVRTVLDRCAGAAAWYPDFDPDALLLVLVSALGLIDPDEAPNVGREVLIAQAMFVIADLSALDPAGVGAHLAAAVAEIRRAETMEMP
jgi:hypothetical protein